MRSLFVFSMLLLQTVKSFGNDSLNHYFNNGNVAYEQHNFTEAIAQYNRALHLDSTFYAARFARGMAYYSVKNFEYAMIDFTTCASMNPKDKKAYLQRGIIEFMTLDYEAALMDFKMCNKLDPADSQINLYIEYCKLNLHGF